MMKIIFFKLNNKDIFKIDNRKSNFPIEVFSEISLRTLLGILQRLENKFTYQYKCSQRLDMERIKIRSTISQSFTNWPSNFPELIAELSVKKNQEILPISNVFKMHF